MLAGLYEDDEDEGTLREKGAKPEGGVEGARGADGADGVDGSVSGFANNFVDEAALDELMVDELLMEEGMGMEDMEGWESFFNIDMEEDLFLSDGE